MHDFKRWTVRNVNPETIKIINLMSAFSGVTTGEILNEAVSDWFENLEEEDDEIDTENL